MTGTPLFPVVGQTQTGAKHVAVLGGLFPDAGSIPAASTICIVFNVQQNPGMNEKPA